MRPANLAPKNRSCATMSAKTVLLAVGAPRRCRLCLRVLERVCGLQHAPSLLMATCLLCTRAMRQVEVLALTTVVVASREQGILVMIASQLQTAVLSFDGPGGAKVRARTRPRGLLHPSRSLSR
jgi:hypothetical protein